MQRLFIPGSEWLYFKIYTGNKTGDFILTDYILPVTNKLLSEHLIDKWFFLRYSDPDFHIRFRIHINNPNDYGYIFKIIYSAFQELTDKKHIYKIMCDSYNRELERYGEEAFELTETLFYIDSVSVLSILNEIKINNDREEQRWCIALRFIDDILNAFNYTLIEKRDFMLQQSEGFKKEFGFTSIPLIRQLNNKYRINRDIIEKSFSIENNLPHYRIADNRLNSLQTLVHQILAIYPSDHKNTGNYISAIIHMTINRLFHSSNRVYEMVLYDFLFRHYKSQIARIKY